MTTNVGGGHRLGTVPSPYQAMRRRVKLSTIIRAPHRRLRTGATVEVMLGDGSVVTGVVLEDSDGVVRIGLDGP